MDYGVFRVVLCDFIGSWGWVLRRVFNAMPFCFSLEGQIL